MRNLNIFPKNQAILRCQEQHRIYLRLAMATLKCYNMYCKMIYKEKYEEFEHLNTINSDHNL